MIAIGQINLVFDATRRHDEIRYSGILIGERGRNQKGIGAQQREAAHGLRKLNVIADQQPDLETAEVEGHFKLAARLVGGALSRPEQVRFSVTRQNRPVSADDLDRVVELSAGLIALGVAIGDRRSEEHTSELQS